MDMNVINIDAFWSDFLFGLVLSSIVLIPIAIILIVWALAQFDIFFTMVRENEAKAVITNGKFVKFLMASRSLAFKGKTDGEWVDRWDVVEMTEIKTEQEERKLDKFSATRNMFGGLRWVGLWPFTQIYTYRFTWTSLEQLPGKEDEKTSLVAKTTDNNAIDYIMLKKDIYGLLLGKVETSELLPVNIMVQIPARVINPYKALFVSERWLEQVENLIADRLRLFVGKKSFSELISRKGESESIIDDEDLGGILGSIKDDFGIEITFIGIRKVDPASDKTEEFLKAAGAVFVADQNAKAAKIEGVGQKDRVTTYYGAVSKIPGGTAMLTAEAIRDSKLTVVTTSGGGILPTVTVADATGKENKDE